MVKVNEDRIVVITEKDAEIRSTKLYTALDY